MVSSLRLPRWTALLFLPFLVGALVLMHGLDAGATTTGLHATSSVAPTHAHHGETSAAHHDEGCEGCAVGHVMAACVAIVATVVGLRLARRATGAHPWAPIVAARGRIRASRQVRRPPDPAWLRLAVMRC